MKSHKERVRPRAGKNEHRLRQHRSHLRRRTADCGCEWTTELSTKPRWRTDILTHWSRRCSTRPQEFLSPHPNQGRRRVQSCVSHPARSSSTESCRSGWRPHQLPYNQATNQLEEISHRQSNDLEREGWPYRNRNPHIRWPYRSCRNEGPQCT